MRLGALLVMLMIAGCIDSADPHPEATAAKEPVFVCDGIVVASLPCPEAK